ncbi:MAG: hypothetical protein LQ351_001414 [Letrouitia transgressa]|nr:MAG: hypothetical protein LQ351_001414 [Letrouitia transgressa]
MPWVDEPGSTIALPPSSDLHPASDQILLSTLSDSAHSFLQPPPTLHQASLVLAKRFLDPLALVAAQAEEERRYQSKKKRKRGHADEQASQNRFGLKRIHLEGFGTQHIWQQAKRVLDASLQRVEIALDHPEPPNGLGKGGIGKISSGQKNNVKHVSFDTSPSLDGSSAGSKSGSDAQAAELIDDEIEELEAQDLGDLYDRGRRGSSEPASSGTDDIDTGIVNGQIDSDLDEEPNDVFVQDKFGLNDGFFSIDNFNKQTEFLERQDARGEPEKESMDEEDIDWDAEPSAMASDKLAVQEVEENGHLTDEDGDDEEDEEGPVFDGGDLNAPDADMYASDDDDALEELDQAANTNEIMYNDFFAPPSRKASASKHPRALPKTQPSQLENSHFDPQEDDVQRTIAAVRRDIFEDELSSDDAPESRIDSGRADPNSHRSTHEKRKAELTKEIRRLEAANVARREWTLTGEARAADRPYNSLLEEDLEFERAGKPVPIVTSEVSRDIETLIKQRILAREFDEVTKRRPTDLVTGAGAKRGRIELDDTKPQQSLAELYEAEYLKNADPGSYMEKRDEKLKAEHANIERLWAEVSAQLDALSSWHYKPKPPATEITVVSDVPKMTMEDARPGASEGMSGEISMLAPQEIYKPGEERSKRDERKEVVPRSGAPVAREEMTREEKLRRRRREKERLKKAGLVVKTKKNGGTNQRALEGKRIVGDLKRAGVKVIGKKGEIRDVEGRAIKGKGGATKGGGKFKL